MSELLRLAMLAGVDEQSLEAAIESDEPKGAVLALIAENELTATLAAAKQQQPPRPSPRPQPQPQQLPPPQATTLTTVAPQLVPVPPANTPARAKEVFDDL